MISENLVGYSPFRLTASGFVKSSGGFLKHCIINPTGTATWTLDIIDDITINHVTNGTFTGSATGWTLSTPWVYGTNNISIDGSQLTAKGATQDIPALIPGVSYVVTYTTTRTAGSVTPILGGTSGTARSTAATFTETIVCGTTNTLLKFNADADFAGTIDTVSMYKLPCYTAVQAGTGTFVANASGFLPCNFGFQYGCYLLFTSIASVSGSYV